MVSRKFASSMYETRVLQTALRKLLQPVSLILILLVLAAPANAATKDDNRRSLTCKSSDDERYYPILECPPVSALMRSAKISKYCKAAFKPVAIHQFKDVPLPAREVIKDYLVKRLGQNTADKLIFKAGKLIDLAALRQARPEALEFKNEIPSIILHFELMLPELRQPLYAQLYTRSDGTPIVDINLPNISVFPERARIIDTHQAFEAAIRQGLEAEKFESCAIYYYAKMEHIRYHFTQLVTGYSSSNATFKVYSIDAHTGNPTGISEGWTIVD